MMQERQLFKSKEIKNIYLIVLEDLGDTFLVTYELSKISPSRKYKYNKEYLYAFYEEAGTTKWYHE